MNKSSKEEINKLINQYRALTVERLEVENAMIKGYETIMIYNDTAKKTKNFEEVSLLKQRLSYINKKISKTDKQILKLLEQTDS
jgi:hypothetical protein